jgi:Tir chaperone protein (CesT) family
MRSEKDVEAYLGRLNRRFESVQNGGTTFLIHSGEKFPAIALRVDPPLVLLRVHIGDVGPDTSTDLYRKLLSLNAKSLVHSSFGLEDDRIVLSSALELENLDFNELESALDEIDLAVAQHVPVLAELTKSPASSRASKGKA